MIRLRLATSDGFQEITPATLSRCGFTDGCQHASYVLFRILARALAHLHRERMDAEGRALRFGRVTDSVLYPGAEWTVLGENPSWNPPKE